MNRIIAPIKMCIFTIYFINVRHFIYLFLLIFIFSCGKKRKDISTNSQERPKLSVVVEHGGSGGSAAAPIAKKVINQLTNLYSNLSIQSAHTTDAKAAGQRSLRNTALGYITKVDDGNTAFQQFKTENNMTEQPASLGFKIKTNKKHSHIESF